MAVAPFIQLVFVLIYLGGFALILTIIILVIQALILSIRALKKYLQS